MLFIQDKSLQTTLCIQLTSCMCTYNSNLLTFYIYEEPHHQTPMACVPYYLRSPSEVKMLPAEPTLSTAP